MSAPRHGTAECVADLLAQLTDDQLEQPSSAAHRFTLEVESDIGNVAGAIIGETLAWAVAGEGIRRYEMMEQARAVVDANGHEVWIDHDTVAAAQTGLGWSVYCTCRNPALDGYRASFAEVRDLAVSHAADHGGRWGDGYPGTDADYG